MKQLLFTLALAVSCLVAHAQHFEGKIVYRNTYTSKTPGLSNGQLNSMMGDVQNWYTKAGDYRSELNGTQMAWQVYRNSENKLYSKFTGSNKLLWNDGAANPDSVLSMTLRKGAATILGYACDELTLVCRSGVQKYYFSPRLPVDPDLYQAHRYGNWYAYLSKAGAVPLKMVIETPQFSMESVATGVHPMKLGNTFFAIPADAQTSKSPY
ncbi:hypothetical protein I2I05_19830 [Hymenobacter sp. BT683]|uniref:GLPGLI family protein n=1 Tax=Hymenobacter jeongseonensis TaxID=2791027 RepID=A0ABS0IMT7_9BACT|nr:hypothetical protein [Hymenobacter jeongseonensis]MBF9239653.1 hypothetical protein [Hymenobacter jeongseonensis]